MRLCMVCVAKICFIIVSVVALDSDNKMREYYSMIPLSKEAKARYEEKL